MSLQKSRKTCEGEMIVQGTRMDSTLRPPAVARLPSSLAAALGRADGGREDRVQPRVADNRFIEWSIFIAIGGGLRGNARLDRQVGGDPLLAVRAVSRRVELGGGQLEAGRRRAEREDALHRAFTVGAFTDHRRPMMILKGSGEDLAGAGAVMVHQQVHGHAPSGPAACSQDLALTGSPAAGRDDHALVNESLGDLHGYVEQTARVAPQVQNQSPHSQGLKARDGLVELFGRRLLKAREAYVADALGRVDHLGAW